MTHTMHAPGIRRSTTRVRLVEAGHVVTHAPDWTDGVASRCGIDLRGNPELIDLIELVGRPALREQLKVLSQPFGPFMTIACSMSTTTRLFPPGGPPVWKASTSVQLEFIDRTRCTLDNYASLAHALLDGLGGDPHPTRWNRLVELRPDLVEFHPGDRAAWSLTILTSAYGLEGGAAVRELELCLHAQTAVIAAWTGPKSPVPSDL